MTIRQLLDHDITRVVVIDFETFYSQEFSLSKLPTQAYIEDPQFHIIGVGCIDSTTPNRYHWIPSPDAAARFIRELNLEAPGTLTVAHNVMFDGGVLEYHLGVRPWMYFCTMMGARPHLVPFTPQQKMSLAALETHVDVGPKMGFVAQAKGKRYVDFTSDELSRYGDYCVRDCEICLALAQLIIPNLPWDELLLLDSTIKMFTRPRLRLNRKVLSTYLAQLKFDKAVLLEQSGVKDPTQLRSNERFADLLVAHGLMKSDLPKKISPTTGKETYAFARTDKAFKAVVLESDNEMIQALGAARVGFKSTLAESRAQRLLDISVLPSGLFGAPLLYWGAHTGRFSGFDSLNLQNLPRGSALRKAIIALPGFRVVSGDLSQIEARILAALAGETKLLNIFALGLDPYRAFATIVYQVPYDQVTSFQRRVCKSAILGLGFGMSGDRFAEYLAINGVIGLSRREINALVYDHYRGTYARIPNLWDEAASWLRILQGLAPPKRYKCIFIAKGFIGLPNGMVLHYPNCGFAGGEGELHYGIGKRTKIYPAKVVENVVQALARIAMTRAVLWLQVRNIYPVLSVHDEPIYVAHKTNWPKLARAVRYALSRELPWLPGLKIDCEVKVGLSYGNSHAAPT